MQPAGSILMNSIWFAKRLRRLHVVVPDHAARLEVAGVVHQLEVGVADVVQHLHVFDGLLNGCRDSSSQSIVQPTFLPASAWCWNVRTTRSQISS